MKISIVKACAFFIVYSLMVLGSCKKSSVKAKADFLVSSPWKYSTAQYDLDNNGTADGTLPAGFLQACDLDNIITFKADKTGVADEGAAKCDASSAQTRPFTWSINSDETQLVINGVIFTGINDTFKIIELTDSKLVVSQQISTSSLSLPIPLPLPLATVVVTFIH